MIEVDCPMIEPLNPEVVILNAALELPAAERRAYLDNACKGDVALRRQVETLLRAHEQAADFLEAPIAGLTLNRTSSITLTEKSGDRIGRYKLLQQIGEGGCGVVYMAEQEEPVRRRVAFKVIKLGMDTRQIIARFEAERQALALMDHQHIARVFDAGATDSGRPYFVMELVQGIPITDFCDEHALSTEERLKLFIQVCHALQHAHQKGVIHRDIKPSNILVMVSDGVLVPKVIDFGIAKAAQGRLTDQTHFTAFEQFIGTPAYMSPEQAVMTSLDVDTRSDIYSLGVLLYELLTGRTPFDQKELLAAGLDEMRRTIREVEPVRPSTRLSRERLAMRRLGSVKSAIRNPQSAINQDLDWIVMKCLEKDRARRYETANGLAADVQRHLLHEPITARPPTGLYRLRKLIQRNKLAFVAVGVLAIALVTVAVGSTIAAWRVAHARRAETSHREKAETANRQLRRTVSLLELGRAEDFFRSQDAAAGVAHLAAMLRSDPSNHIAANRLVSALLHRNWALPAALMRHLGPVEKVCFSPNGKCVLSASRDATANLWDAATGRSLAAVRHRDRILQACFNPDGSRFVTASLDGTAQIWDTKSGAALSSPLTHSNTVYWAEFSADGRQVLTASADRTARIWDVASGELKRELRGHSSHVILARFSPDGARIVTGGNMGSIRLWNADSGEMLFRVEDRNRPLTALAFSPDGRSLLVACADGVARVWNTSYGQSMGKPMEHKEPIDYAVFSPDSRLVLTTSQDNTAKLWDAQTGEPVGQPLVHEGGVLFGGFSPDGQAIVTTSMDNSARLWDARTAAPLCQPLRQYERIFQAHFSPDGRQLVTGSYDWFVQIWDIRPRRSFESEFQEERVSSVAFSPDGNMLLTASRDARAQLWNARTGQPIGEPIRHSGPVHMAAFSRDGLKFVTASTSRSTYVRDAATGAMVAGPFQHTSGLHWAAFSPEGERIVTAVADGTAQVWNIRTAQPITPPLVHQGEVRMALFSPDGRLVVTASDDHSARVWDAESGQAVGGPLLHLDHVKWAAFSPDSEKVVTASTDNTACIWEARTAKRLVPPLQHARIVEKVVFSPDGRRVATASLDRTARIWDAATGQAVTPPLQHNGPLTELAYSPDGRRVLTGCRNEGVVRLWDAETGRPLTEWLNIGSRLSSVCFDTTGEHIAAAGRGARVWNLPFAPTPVPEWFPAFAQAVAGIRLDERGNAELVPRTELDQMAGRLPRKGSGDFYERLARWFLADPANRETAPF
jgi:eukaryotic-like serine/threonine-protein kinase